MLARAAVNANRGLGEFPSRSRTATSGTSEPRGVNSRRGAFESRSIAAAASPGGGGLSPFGTPR